MSENSFNIQIHFVAAEVDGPASIIIKNSNLKEVF
jgi:hypothetical protein